MTREEAIERLKAADTGDIEGDHGEADRVLCEFLRSLGFYDVVEAFEAVEKWYA